MIILQIKENQKKIKKLKPCIINTKKGGTLELLTLRGSFNKFLY